MFQRVVSGIDKKLPKLIIGTAHPSVVGMRNAENKIQARENTFRFLDELWDLGLNMYDCAAIYGEEVMGEYLTERKRHKDAVIVTKCAHPNRYRNRVTPFDMESDLYDSLAKLNTDYIDLYLLHRDDPNIPVSLIVDTLNRFRREGKIGAFGGSNWTVERIQEANAYALANGLQPFTISSPNYGLAHQVTDLWGWGSVTLTGQEHAEDREWYRQNDMPVFAYSSMAHGFLSGKFKSNEMDKAKQVLEPVAQKGFLCEENMERLRRAEIFAEKYGCTVSEIAIGYMFHHNLMVYPIISGSKKKYFEQALQAMEIPFTEEEIRWLDLKTV